MSRIQLPDKVGEGMVVLEDTVRITVEEIQRDLMNEDRDMVKVRVEFLRGKEVIRERNRVLHLQKNDTLTIGGIDFNVTL